MVVSHMMKKKNKSGVVARSDSGVVRTSDSQQNHGEQWDMFIKVVVAHVDPVLASMLYATKFLQFDAAQKVVRVATLKKFILFQDLFIEQKHLYQEYLDRIFGFQTLLIVDFTNVVEPKKVELKVLESQRIEHTVSATDLQSEYRSQAQGQKQAVVQKYPRSVDRSLDVSDTQKWKVTNALLEHFGGTVREIVKDIHEFDA